MIAQMRSADTPLSGGITKLDTHTEMFVAAGDRSSPITVAPRSANAIEMPLFSISSALFASCRETVRPMPPKSISVR